MSKTPQGAAGKFDTDVAVIGSGFGGSVAAHRLSEKGYGVTVFEKGKRWRPEDFPKTNWNIRKSFWFPKIGCRGIFAMRLLREALVLHGVGVGGGSLVYANTLFEPPETVWDDPQWKGLEDWRAVMPEHFNTARRMLGVTENPKLGPADEALRRAAARRGQSGDLSQHTGWDLLSATPTSQSRIRTLTARVRNAPAALSVAAAWSGVDPGAKNTLDKNYLYLAERAGAQIIPDTMVTLGGGFAGGRLPPLLAPF